MGPSSRQPQPLGDVLGARPLVLAVDGAFEPAAPVAELAPHQVAELVGVVQEALLEHLLVEARAVEACRHAQLDVAAQRRVRRRGHDAFRVVALIQHQALKHHLAVEPDRLAIDAHGA